MCPVVQGMETINPEDGSGTVVVIGGSIGGEAFGTGPGLGIFGINQFHPQYFKKKM